MGVPSSSEAFIKETGLPGADLGFLRGGANHSSGSLKLGGTAPQKL